MVIQESGWNNVLKMTSTYAIHCIDLFLFHFNDLNQTKICWNHPDLSLYYSRWQLTPLCVVLSDMRKALSHDVNNTSIIPLTHPVRPEELDWW